MGNGVFELDDSAAKNERFYRRIERPGRGPAIFERSENCGGTDVSHAEIKLNAQR